MLIDYTFLRLIVNRSYATARRKVATLNDTNRFVWQALAKVTVGSVISNILNS